MVSAKQEEVSNSQSVKFIAFGKAKIRGLHFTAIPVFLLFSQFFFFRGGSLDEWEKAGGKRLFLLFTKKSLLFL